MELYIFDSNLQFLTIIDCYTQFRWVRRFYSNGEFELSAPLNSLTLEILKENNIIVKKDSTEAGMINYRQLKLNSNGVEEINVKGKFIKDILSRRIVWGTENYNNYNTELMLRDLVNKNVIDPSNINRKIPSVILGDLNNYTDVISKQISYKNLLEIMEDVTLISNIGTRLDFSVADKKLVFNTYKPLDRTINQNINVPAIFTKEFDNILEQEFTSSNTNYKNTVFVAGAGQGINRKKITIDSGNKGLDRVELFVDARDLQDTKSVTSGDNTEEVPIPLEEYNKLLLNRGQEKLKECVDVNSFTSKINVNQNNLIYKQDYDLGDIVTCINRKWNIKVNTRITEVEEFFNTNGKEINIVFGQELPTLIDKIKQLKK